MFRALVYTKWSLIAPAVTYRLRVCPGFRLKMILREGPSVVSMSAMTQSVRAVFIVSVLPTYSSLITNDPRALA